MEDEIARRVILTIQDQLGISTEQITPERSLVADLAYDSMDQVETVMFLEEEFSIRIEDDDAEACKTVADLIALVKKQMGKPA